MVNDALRTIKNQPHQLLAATGTDTIRAYEDAATAVGRLDAAGALALSGLQRLLVLRCVAQSLGASRDGMIALLRPDGEGDQALRAYRDALHAGASRARGGVVPSLATLQELLAIEPLEGGEVVALDALLRDTHEKTPPILKAALAAGAILRSAAHREGTANAGNSTKLAALAVSLVLCVGGATTDAWLTLPLFDDESLSDGPGEGDTGWDEWLGTAFGSLAREARSAQRGVSLARDLADSDIVRVSEALGRAAYSALEVLALLRAELVITVPDAARALELTPPTAGAAVARLSELGIAHEVTGRARSRAFVYGALVDALAPAAQ
jgi:hypothetical protein